MDVRLYHWKAFNRNEVDYTGRWTIVNRSDQDPELFIECFTLQEQVDVVKEASGLLWWKTPAITRKKIRADVQWISERYLQVCVTETFVNCCGSGGDNG